jgi:hypothetical protein
MRAHTPAETGRPARRALALAGCGVLALSLSACESTEQESAKIGHESEAAARASTLASAKHHAPARTRGHVHGAAHRAPIHATATP